MLIYDRCDESGAKQLRTHMSPLKNAGLVQILDRNTEAGSHLSKVDEELLARGDIFLFLLSPESAEDPLIKGAMDKGARTIPVLYRSTDWKSGPLGRLTALPRRENFIASSSNRDEEWMRISQEIRGLAERIHQSKSPPPPRKLSEHTLRAVHEAIVSAGLDRNSLMSCLEKRLVAGFRQGRSVFDQHWMDLNDLNDMGNMADGNSPMDSYLRTAIQLAGPRRERTVFEEARAALRR